MSDDIRVVRGWIYFDGARQDDGTIKYGDTGQEMRLNPIEAISQREEGHVETRHVLKASAQRLLFWRR
jgi:hypothetical protein